MFYNYIYLDPRKPGKFCYPELNFSLLYEPFYVGKGCKSKGTVTRKYHHMQKSSLKRHNAKTNKIKLLLKQGYDLRKYVFQINKELTEKEAFIIEIFLIKQIGRLNLKTGPLANFTDGGEGNSGLIPKSKGKTYSQIYGNKKADEILSKMSQAFSGQNNPASKSKMSEEKRKEKGQKSIKTRLENGQIKSGSSCNFSKDYLGEEKMRLKNIKSAETLRKKILNGYTPPKIARLPKILAISPDGKEIIFQGIQTFSKRYNLSIALIKKWINNGKITFNSYNKTKKFKEQYYNTIGWEFKSID